MTSTVPFAMLLHTPADAVSAHDLQMPVQAVWQQTPCSQKLERHSFLFAQIAPFALRPQKPPVQTAGGWQCASTVQDGRHAAVPQVYGKQGIGLGVTQVPAPSQAESGVNRLLAVGHVAGMQGVPDT